MNPNIEQNLNPTPISIPDVAMPVAQNNPSPVILPDINFSTGKVIDPSKQRHFLAVFFLSFIFGVFGIDRFYLGKIWTGILKLLTFGGLGVWALIDLNAIISGGMRDKQGNKLLEVERYRKFANRTVLITSLVVLTIFVLVSVVSVYFVSSFLQNGGIDGFIQSMLDGSNQNLNLGL